MFCLAFRLPLSRRRSNRRAPVSATTQRVLDKYCVTCHNQRLRTAGLALDTLDVAKPAANAEVWERVIAKLRARLDAAAGTAAARCGDLSTRGRLAGDRDRSRVGGATRIPAGSAPSIVSIARNTTTRSATCSRSTSTSKSLLPGDETADGSFDNFADVLSISTAHLERYMSVARQVTRLATGLPPASPGDSSTFEIPLHVVQDDRQSEDLPLRIARRHRDSTTTFPSTASTRSRSVSGGSIRTTSWAWAGRSSSTSASTASC